MPCPLTVAQAAFTPSLVFSPFFFFFLLSSPYFFSAPLFLFSWTAPPVPSSPVTGMEDALEKTKGLICFRESQGLS